VNVLSVVEWLYCEVWLVAIEYKLMSLNISLESFEWGVKKYELYEVI